MISHSSFRTQDSSFAISHSSFPIHHSSFEQLLLAALAAASVLAQTQARGEDWPQWRGPNRDGRASAVSLNHDWSAHPPALLWMTDGIGAGFASVAVRGERIYVGGDLEQGQGVTALNRADGAVLWKSTLTESVPRHDSPGARCTPTLDGDRLYMVTSNGALHCLAVADGAVLWQKDFEREWGGKMMSGWGFSESPLVDGDRLVCTPGGPQALVVALNKETGVEIWRGTLPDIGSNGDDGAGYSSIVISEGGGLRQYIQLVGRGLVSFRSDNGAFLWGYNRIANGTANIPTAIVQDDLVFASSGYGTGAALLRLSAAGSGVRAEEVYFLDGDTFQNHHGGMVLVGDYIYAGHGHNRGRPICIELETGRVAWGGRELEAPGDGSAAVLYADGHLVFRYQDGTVALIEAVPEEYRLKGTFTPEFVKKPSWAHPVIVDGRLYLREDSRLMCYSLQPPTATALLRR